MKKRSPKSMSGDEMTGKPNVQISPGSIFICYRREDSADITGRIYDRLVDHFGAERVFIDVEAIRLGYDFRSEIDETIKVCSIVIVVIGDKWLIPLDGKRRIDDENDRVRIEIEAALKREIPIIPILVRGASHPTKVMLPGSLEALAFRHGTSIRHEHFRTDVDFLISQMDRLLALRESTQFTSAHSRESQEREVDARSETGPVRPGENTPQFPTQAMLPERESRMERRQQDKVARTKDGTTSVKSTKTTQSRPTSAPIVSTPAITPIGEPAVVWTRKRLIVVAAVGIAMVLLLGIGRQLTGPHGFPRNGVDRADVGQKPTSQQDAAAQFDLGVLYENGRGVPKNLEKAAEFHQKAANQGNAPAQCNLGALYAKGQGVTKDLGKAVELFQKAADQGYFRAQYDLGFAYSSGQGVTKDRQGSRTLSKSGRPRIRSRAG